MAHIPTDQEVDQLRNWLKSKLPIIPQKTLRPPSPALLELAWQAAKAHREYLFDQGYEERLTLPLAASDGTSAPFEIENIGGEWSVTPVRIPGDQNWQILRWRCRPEFLELYEGRQIFATIAGEAFDLGTVFDGSAETLIPGHFDLRRDAVGIRIEKIISED